jgi:hypothetical protein
MNRKGSAAIAILIVLLLILAIGGIWYYEEQYDKPKPIAIDNFGSNSTTTQSSASSSSTNDVNFTGIITAVQDSRDVDGGLSIEVDNKWIDIDNEGLSINAPTPGSVIGLDLEANTQTYIGKKVEVFAEAAPSSSHYLSITGNAKYYVKVVQ